MNNKFVGFFDILGFKNLVAKNSHEKLCEIYQEVLIDSVDEIRRIGLELHKNDETALKSLESIRQFIISDSIILVQNDFSHRGLFFITLLAKVLLKISMHEGIPLRGAISVGPATILEDFGTTVIGQGLVNAYSLESTQHWSGAIIDDRCFQIHQNDKSFLKLLELKSPILLKYSVPIKTQENKDHYVINWLDDNTTLEEIGASFLRHGKELVLDKEKQLVSNTIDFAKYSIIFNKTFKQIEKAREFFQFMAKSFGLSIKSVSKDSFIKLINPKRNDLLGFLLESPFYSLVENDNKKYLKHKMSEKILDVDEVLNQINIDSFKSYFELTVENRVKTLNGLE